jgi:hypothetical protein
VTISEDPPPKSWQTNTRLLPLLPSLPLSPPTRLPSPEIKALAERGTELEEEEEEKEKGEKEEEEEMEEKEEEKEKEEE